MKLIVPNFFIAVGLAICLGQSTEYSPYNDGKDYYAYAVEDSCITYDFKTRLISIGCKSVRISDIDKQISNSSIIMKEYDNGDTKSKNTNGSQNIWILKAGIIIKEYASLLIDSNDTKWLKMVPVATKQLQQTDNNNIQNQSVVNLDTGGDSVFDDGIYVVSKNNGNNPNGIHVFGSLIIDSVKITSWDPESHVIKFQRGKRAGEEHTKTKYDTAEPRPFIRISNQATGTTNITNSEIAYLGYSCSKCSGLSYYGGIGSVIKDNDIHHLLKGYYSNGMGYMTIEDNKFHDNYLYGIDPHTGTHNLVIRNNIVHDNNASGIICSKDCYELLIEGNKVYDNGGVGRGIAFSINTTHSVARNNEVHDQSRCISFNRESNYNEVYSNIISHCGTAIYLANTSENSIHDNKISRSDNGISFKETTNSINDNMIRQTENGIIYINTSTSKLIGLDIPLKTDQRYYADFLNKLTKENRFLDVNEQVSVKN